MHGRLPRFAIVLFLLMTMGCAASLEQSGEGKPLITPPDPTLPQGIQALSGKWRGRWQSEQEGGGGLDAVLWVVEIQETEAQIIYGWGDSPEWGIEKSLDTFSARVTHGKLQWEKEDAGLKFEFQLGPDRDTLLGKVVSSSGTSTTTMRRVPYMRVTP